MPTIAWRWDFKASFRKWSLIASNFRNKPNYYNSMLEPIFSLDYWWYNSHPRRLRLIYTTDVRRRMRSSNASTSSGVGSYRFTSPLGRMIEPGMYSVVYWSISFAYFRKRDRKYNAITEIMEWKELINTMKTLEAPTQAYLLQHQQSGTTVNMETIPIVIPATFALARVLSDIFFSLTSSQTHLNVFQNQGLLHLSRVVASE